jgi:hypothetical protein
VASCLAFKSEENEKIATTENSFVLGGATASLISEATKEFVFEK